MLPLLISLILFVLPVDSVDHRKDAPDTLTISLIRNHTTYFSLEDTQFVDADSLIQVMKEAQFIALGEIHNSRRLSEFTSALMHLLKPVGFEDMLVETGPYSAEKLEALIASDRGKEAVREFYAKYSSTLFQYYPIPFFTGKADLQMLETAHELGFNLTGIDQEFAFSTRYLVDELSHSSDEPLSDRQLDLLETITSKLPWWYRWSALSSSFDLSCHIRKYEPYQQFLSTISNPNDTQQRIIDAMKKSLEIYCLNERGNWSEGNRQRIAYFKSNFDAFYKQATELDATQRPKAILKMGSYHSGRHKSPIGIYDIGHHVATLADSLETTSVHLRFLNRYFEDGRDVMGEENWSASTRFIAVGVRNQWALIDTKNLRTQIRERQLTGTPFEVREILNYDYIIIMPEDVRAVKHY